MTAAGPRRRRFSVEAAGNDGRWCAGRDRGRTHSAAGCVRGPGWPPLGRPTGPESGGQQGRARRGSPERLDEGAPMTHGQARPAAAVPARRRGGDYRRRRACRRVSRTALRPPGRCPATRRREAEGARGRSPAEGRARRRGTPISATGLPQAAEGSAGPWVRTDRAGRAGQDARRAPRQGPWRFGRGRARRRAGDWCGPTSTMGCSVVLWCAVAVVNHRPPAPRLRGAALRARPARPGPDPAASGHDRPVFNCSAHRPAD